MGTGHSEAPGKVTAVFFRAVDSELVLVPVGHGGPLLSGVGMGFCRRWRRQRLQFSQSTYPCVRED